MARDAQLDILPEVAAENGQRVSTASDAVQATICKTSSSTRCRTFTMTPHAMMVVSISRPTRAIPSSQDNISLNPSAACGRLRSVGFWSENGDGRHRRRRMDVDMSQTNVHVLGSRRPHSNVRHRTKRCHQRRPLTRSLSLCKPRARAALRWQPGAVPHDRRRNRPATPARHLPRSNGSKSMRSADRHVVRTVRRASRARAAPRRPASRSASRCSDERNH